MAKKNGGMKEFVRKRLVALKRKPQMIALVVLAVAFVYFTLNLTHVSNTTAGINYPGMGLSAFVITLFSVLAMVCFLNAFPRRKKVNIPMLLLMFLMLGGVVGCSFYYESQIDTKIVDTRVQFLVAAQNNVRNANAGAAAAPKSVSAAKASVNAAEKAAKAAEETRAAVEEAIAVTTADKAVCDAATKNVEKAVADAQKAVTNAQKALETAAASAEEAKQKAGAAPASADLAAVNAAARAAINAANKAANAATTAENAVISAQTALQNAENALATVDVWTAVKQMKAEVETLKKGSQEPKAPAAAAAAKETVQETVELPEAIVNEAMAQGDAKVTELLTKVVAGQTEPSSVSMAKSVLQVHRVILLVAVVLTVLLPVYTPLLRKIRTSIEVEANEDMGEIELDNSGE